VPATSNSSSPGYHVFLQDGQTNIERDQDTGPRIDKRALLLSPLLSIGIPQEQTSASGRFPEPMARSKADSALAPAQRTAARMLLSHASRSALPAFDAFLRMRLTS